MDPNRKSSTRAPPWGAQYAPAEEPADKKRSPPDDPPDPVKRARVEEGGMSHSQEGSQISHPLPSIPPSRPSNFPIHPLTRFQGASASIKRPREIAHFSYDDNHEYKEDESGVNYYHPPQMGADLREGFDTFRHYEDTENPHLDSLLRTLVSKEKREGERVQTDFVMWRGMMTKIMTTPFDMFAEFDLFATLHQGTIYIEEDFNKKAASRASESNSQSRHARPSHLPSHEIMTYFGYKFETLSLLPDLSSNVPRETIENREKAVTSNYAQHCSIVRTGFGTHSLVLGGEVDGLWEPKPDLQKFPDAPIQWIELKTSEELGQYPSDRDILKYERKLLKFWAQSFLLGVSKIIVGFRTKHGILRGLDVYETTKIPGMVRRGTGCWDGNTCINFATAFLDHLKRSITQEGVYKITLRKKSGVIEIAKVQQEGNGGILSEEFTTWRDDKAADTARDGEGAPK
ncbi:RAI1-domain-containing protein [Polyplosphaeria fusca]|uniref:Decapping nuclease n=1 Tax=Polyplosphaeria fusca TaxID=682080 RepID=A0A9P4R2J5_9PLEO|nr:RAI1-domain-containing protein [Polyplosphaeria fusca]